MSCQNCGRRNQKKSTYPPKTSREVIQSLFLKKLRRKILDGDMRKIKK